MRGWLKYAAPLANVNPFRGLVSSFFIRRSASVCARAVERREYLCADCLRQAPRIHPAILREMLATILRRDHAERSPARIASDRVLHFDAAVSAYRSRGVVRKWCTISNTAAKFISAILLGRWLGETLDDPRLPAAALIYIVPVPLHPARERERGFNQAELLAPSCSARQRTGRCSNVLAADSLHHHPDRIRSGGADGKFAGCLSFTKKQRTCESCGCCLIDDVLTTGSTLSECASVLKKAGALSVHAATAARGLSHGHFQKTLAQDAEPQEARDAAGPLAEVPRLRRGRARNRAGPRTSASVRAAITISRSRPRNGSRISATPKASSSCDAG